MRVNEILCLELNSFCHQLNGSAHIYEKFKSSTNVVAMVVTANGDDDDDDGGGGGSCVSSATLK